MLKKMFFLFAAVCSLSATSVIFANETAAGEESVKTETTSETADNSDEKSQEDHA
jgi:hypothetical protein